MISRSKPSHLSEAVITSRKLERNFLKTQLVSIDQDRNNVHLTTDRHKETFLQSTRKRHETWYRHDKFFRDALKKEKDRHEKRLGSTERSDSIILPSLITINSRPEPMTKVEQRTYQVLNASQKLLDKSATRGRSNLNSSRLPTAHQTFLTTSCTYNTASPTVSFRQSIKSDEYNRLMNESLKHETYGDFVDHFVKFRPEFREHFTHVHQRDQRQNAVKQLIEFNQSFAKTKDQRYHNLINILIDCPSGKK